MDYNVLYVLRMLLALHFIEFICGGSVFIVYFFINPFIEEFKRKKKTKKIEDNKNE